MKYDVLYLDDKLDHNGEYFEGCEVEFDNEEVPVFLHFIKDPHHTIGKAIISVDKENKVVQAEIDFFHKEKDKMTMYGKLIPCIGGITLDREGEHIKKIDIKCIGLDILNADSRIETLERQDAKQVN